MGSAPLRGWHSCLKTLRTSPQPQSGTLARDPIMGHHTVCPHTTKIVNVKALYMCNRLSYVLYVGFPKHPVMTAGG